VTTPEIDYAALFAATPSPCLILDPGLVIVDVNEAYLRATDRTRDDLVGQYPFDAFRDNPADPISVRGDSFSALAQQTSAAAAAAGRASHPAL
jgi:PAS domain-containing protein